MVRLEKCLLPDSQRTPAAPAKRGGRGRRDKSEEIQSPSFSVSWLTVVCRVIKENNKVMTCYLVTTLFFIAIILQR